jgi:hypothetical protein
MPGNLVGLMVDELVGAKLKILREMKNEKLRMKNVKGP